ncbi:hypothetical protein ABZ863_27065 [Saccharomonospora sp. NPDC046836]|uniref:hypothetical protein n=1 Tax=Saccharomonospora sp. NPDC046836 TaxID=3156921 RepID=UPI0033FAF3FA
MGTGLLMVLVGLGGPLVMPPTTAILLVTRGVAVTQTARSHGSYRKLRVEGRASGVGLFAVTAIAMSPSESIIVCTSARVTEGVSGRVFNAARAAARWACASLIT